MVTNQKVNLDPHDGHDFTTTTNLMLVSRSVRSEVSRYFYSTNQFFIRYSYDKGLAALRNMAPHAVSLLTDLVVHLTLATCDTSFRHHSQLAGPSIAHQMVCEWLITISYIKAYLTRPARLQLRFICDVDSLELGEQVIQPFLSSLDGKPLLAGCGVRLSRNPDEALSALARRATYAATGTRHAAPFRFLDLQREIRQHIFEFTDLVTPYCEVEWARTGPTKRGVYSFRRRPCECGGYRFQECPPGWHHAWRFQDCRPHDSGCFYARYNSAASTLPSRCHCWAPPTAFFLTCHTMRDDAIHIFFSRNRIVIVPDDGECHIALSSTPARLPVCEFLTDIATPQPDALSSLRFLEIVFPPLGDARGEGVDFLPQGSPAYCEWVSTINQVRDRLSLPVLTLRVYFADRLYPMDDWDGRCFEPNPFRRNMTRDQESAVVAFYFRVVRPLAVLSLLGHFAVDAAWPALWSTRELDRMQRDRRKTFDMMRKLNRLCEELVMGKGYRGGCEEPHIARMDDKVIHPRDSLWLELYNDYRVWT